MATHFWPGTVRRRVPLKDLRVTVGDLFLFFGLFREAELRDSKYRYAPGAPNLHVVYGWLQVGAIIPCADRQLSAIPWARFIHTFAAATVRPTSQVTDWIGR